MTLTYKNATPSVTSVVTQTQINGATDFTIPQQVNGLIEFTPYIAGGTTTAAVAQNSDLLIQSNAVNVNPTRVLIPPITGGLSTVYQTIHPIQASFRWNVPITTGTAPPLQLYNQGLITNGTEPAVGCTIMLSDQGVTEPRQTFWNKRNGVTSTGTAAASVTETTWSVIGGTIIHTLYGAILNGTVTAGEMVAVNVNYASPDFQTPLPAQIELTPLASGLGATTGYIYPQMSKWPCSIPINPVCNLSPVITLQKAVTAASNVATAVGFFKN